MNAEIKIRAFENSDKAALLEILQLNIPAYFDKSEIEDFNTYLDNEAEKYFVAELEGNIVGCGGINFENHYSIGKISWDIINPNHQGIGIGSSLLKHRLDLLKLIDTIKIVSVRTSQHAYKFYEKNGFVLQETHKDYWAKGFDMYKMIYQDIKND